MRTFNQIKLHYTEEGKMRPEKRIRLKNSGMSEEDIEYLESNASEEIEDYLNLKDNLKDKLIARAGLTVEEELSEGYMSLDDLI